MKNFFQILIVISLFGIIGTSCKPEDEVERDMLNEWIWEGMNAYYYWYEDLDHSLYPTELEPTDFFYSILNSQDRFSWIVEDYQALINSFNSEEVTNGISPYFIRLDNSDNVIVVVEYTVPGSPADSAGITRGDIITDINGSEITIHNYQDLFYAETVTLKFADYIDNSFYSNGVEITLNTVLVEENPIHHFEIINYGGSEIAYMVYNHFSVGKNNRWLDSLDHQLAELKSAGIKNLVLDLRYNPGGSIFMANHLASALCPATVPGKDNVFVYLQWNDLFEEFIIREEGEDSGSLVSYFEDTPANNLDLSTIYLLTTAHSASASELLTIGLSPYMNVEHIGETTYGKGYGSITVDDWEEPKRHEWAMQPITFKFANSLGKGVPNEGIDPEYEVDDFIIEAKAFGDITDPQLAKALELITGIQADTKKSSHPLLHYELMPDQLRERRNKAILDRNPQNMEKYAPALN